ncbi:TPA: RDD family protein [Vibrio parahaemolyticus]|uniref:RDD family protein n=1 Tax=Vibrio parahaemolyticus TaxID=670 RepID=UPI00040B232B|nr:RDD family protein [Vibrio parahaemolyticus]EGQ7914570.1 RDD family protein [Vibrio parahaemolyticus]EGQ9864234.1 RDD family protein [Vibrio parahaemolyticus]EGW0146542.1 RDD family protein [Vibrio parahaemolyticus]EHB9911890.1 RDD family protein [Vibrio parahaemolyticus]EIA1797840.1 RDD family protein [Vibrio parahaemolyticus]
METDRDSIIESHRLASPGLRYLGQIIDGAISAAIFIFFLWLGTLIGLSQDSSGLIAFSAAAFYFLLSDGFAKGQSLGKKLLDISVIDSVTGKSCSFPQSFFRNALTPIIGMIDAIFILGKRRQRLGDKLAKTIVVVN